jgi:hypothetical protein
VLLVDDDDAEAGERDALLDQCMCPDRDVDAPVGETVQHVLALRPGDAIGEELDAQRPITEQVARVRHGHSVEHPAHARRVLLGEHLRRRHQRALMAALHRREHRADRDQGLAGTDIALEQTMHRVWASEVGLDLCDRALLGAGQLVPERRVEPADELAGDVVADAS